MLTVKKANRVLKIDESEKDNFLQDGYSVINKKGEIIEQKTTSVSKLEKKNKVLKAENGKLKSELEELKKGLESKDNKKSDK